MTELLQTICEQQGVFLTREALAIGHDHKSLTRGVRDGSLHRVRHGAYTLGDTWCSLDEPDRHRLAARAVLRTARAPALLSHVSAALEYGAPVWDLPLDEVHTTRVSGNAGRREAGICHHQGLLLPDDVSEHHGLPVTSPARTAVDLTTMADAEHALVPINHLLHEGVLTVPDFMARLKRVEHWPDTLTAHVVRQLVNPKLESPGETRTDYLLWAAGLPRPEAQVKIHDAFGFEVARVDFAWPAYGVFLEFDGRVKYQRHLRPGEDATGVVIREKRREERVCELTGWRCIRVTWSDLTRPERLAARVRTVLDGGPRSAA